MIMKEQLLHVQPRQIRAMGLMLAMLGLNGCLFDPFGLKLRRLRSHVDVLESRITQLERFYDVPVSGLEAGAEAVPLTAATPIEELTTSPGSSISTIGSGADVPRGSRWPFFRLPWRKVFGKLTRGFINTITGWVEIPKRADETSTTSGVGAGLTWGVLRGFGHGFVRTAGGIYEVVTFLFPAPPDYQPIMRPRYVFTCEDNELQTGGYRGTQ